MITETVRRTGEPHQAGRPVYYSFLASPIGELLLTGDGEALTGVWFPDDRQTTTVDPSWERDDGVFGEVTRQLTAYFGGELTEFHLPLYARGTSFQERVWEALTRIPYGVTTSYGKLAAELGDPRATRAVGLANGRNPIPIIIPCHRVIGADGSLTGYGGGMHRKQWLLALEGRALPFL
jgi:methylated-DNA-[protein]-cysteine S-methyltransferase